MKPSGNSRTPTTEVDPLFFDLLYTGAALPVGLYYSLYTLHQGSLKDLLESLRQRTGRYPEHPSRKQHPVWIHAASVGEIQSTPPLVNSLTNRGEEIVITTNTLTGRNVARKEYGNDRCLFSPADFSWSVRRALRNLQPKLILLMEQELWPNLISLSRKTDIPILVINGRMGQTSHENYKKAPSIFRKAMFQNLSHACVQNQTYRNRFRNLGVPDDKLTVTGNLKYDSLLENTPSSDEIETLRKKLNIHPDTTVLVGGSIHPPEEEYMVETFRQYRSEHSPEHSRLILVPRHLKNAGKAVKAAKNQNFSTLLMSEISGSHSNTDRADVVVVDEMGILNTVYGLASVVFVGGSMIEHGGQNMLEPSALGKPTVTGPNTFNFEDEMDLLLRNNAIRVADTPETLVRELLSLLTDSEKASQLGQNARRIVSDYGNAVRQTMQCLDPYLS